MHQEVFSERNTQRRLRLKLELVSLVFCVFLSAKVERTPDGALW